MAVRSHPVDEVADRRVQFSEVHQRAIAHLTGHRLLEPVAALHEALVEDVLEPIDTLEDREHHSGSSRSISAPSTRRRSRWIDPILVTVSGVRQSRS